MSKRKIALITDSTCDIPAPLLAEYDINVVPLHVVWGNQVFRDRIDMQPSEFYERLTTDPQHPTTAHPAPATFAEFYERVLSQGAEEIVAIIISSALSGALGAAQQAAQGFDAPIHFVDAKGPTMSLGWQVLAAARAREAGGDAQAMLAAADQARATMVQIVCMDTLEFVHKGGRIGGATRFLGTLLNIKPLVRINHQTGRVEAEAQVRTHRRAVETAYERFFERLDTSKTLRVAVLHGGVPDDAQRLVERMEREYAPTEVLTNITGPVLGVHTGPGAISLCGYTED
jgi:DegV family protein with EDD domain